MQCSKLLLHPWRLSKAFSALICIYSAWLDQRGRGSRNAELIHKSCPPRSPILQAGGQGNAFIKLMARKSCGLCCLWIKKREKEKNMADRAAFKICLEKPHSLPSFPTVALNKFVFGFRFPHMAFVTLITCPSVKGVSFLFISICEWKIIFCCYVVQGHWRALTTSAGPENQCVDSHDFFPNSENKAGLQTVTKMVTFATKNINLRVIFCWDHHWQKNKFTCYG